MIHRLIVELKIESRATRFGCKRDLHWQGERATPCYERRPASSCSRARAADKPAIAEVTQAWIEEATRVGLTEGAQELSVPPRGRNGSHPQEGAGLQQSPLTVSLRAQRTDARLVTSDDVRPPGQHRLAMTMQRP
jgi:hypothetical protein